MSRPLERYFGNDYGKFSEAAVKLGGQEGESHRDNHLWEFKVLPKIPVRMVFYEADEEFSVNIQIMVDKTAQTEDLTIHGDLSKKR